MGVTVKPSELRGKSEKELAKHVEELKESLFQMKMKKAAGALKQTADVRNTKKDIARILTVLKEGTYAEDKGRKSRKQ